MSETALGRCDIAVDRADFQLRAAFDLPGSGITALFGPTGSGKTTILRCLAGLENDATGRIEVAGAVWQDSAAKVFVPPHHRDIGSTLGLARPEGLDAILSRSRSIGPRLASAAFARSGRIRVARAGSRRGSAHPAPRVLAAGDAALAFDPLASRGIYSALRTGFAAADAVIGAGRGDGEAVDRYASLLAADADEYRAELATIYGAVGRFADSPFWQRRRGASMPTWDPAEVSQGAVRAAASTPRVVPETAGAAGRGT